MSERSIPMPRKITFCFTTRSTAVLIIVASCLILPLRSSCSQRNAEDQADSFTPQIFRNQVVEFVRKTAEHPLLAKPTNPPKALDWGEDWRAVVEFYEGGFLRGKGDAEAPELTKALGEATRQALEIQTGIRSEPNLLRQGRFKVSLTNSSGLSLSMIEYNGQGKELLGDIVPIRYVDKSLIFEKIQAGKQYLLRAMHPVKYGFPKKYKAIPGAFEKRLRTIYSASTLLTLMKINDRGRDLEIEKRIPLIANFILSMQNLNPNETTYGAFHYSYDLETDTKEPRFVVGTASKTIFTLLELDRRTQDPIYLEAAKRAGDWLLTMVRPDGMVMSQTYLKEGTWISPEKYSFLYNGQVLSALSRLFRVTQDKKYYDAAQRIAQQIVAKASAQNYYVGDDFRPPNPVSTSWVMMSLLDFTKVNSEELYRQTILNASEKILERQRNDPFDILSYGGWEYCWASGNGWVNEVLTEVHQTCTENGWGSCERFKTAVVKIIRWLIQNTYTEENTFFLAHPEGAIGGLILNPYKEAVRTDAVCHGINGYLAILPYLEDGPLLTVEEKPLGRN
ncbi:MAG: terpene cyclase [Candidatus Omnitrophica bacterium]|nr:terpene cyclase [Candidatus Omnitrophota bacterium]